MKYFVFIFPLVDVYHLHFLFSVIFKANHGGSFQAPRWQNECHRMLRAAQTENVGDLPIQKSPNKGDHQRGKMWEGSFLFLNQDLFRMFIEEVNGGVCHHSHLLRFCRSHFYLYILF